MKKLKSGRHRLILAQMTQFIRMPKAQSEVRPFPKLRNFIMDILSEGRRKNIAHLVFDADFSGIKEHLAEQDRRTGQAISVTSYIAKSFACAIFDDKRMQAYRLGPSRLVVFDDVDIAFIVERDWEGETLPVFHIVRAAQRKTMEEIDRELQTAKTAPLGACGPMNALELRFHQLPRLLRRFAWLFIRHNPYWFKNVAGTVGITSYGMHTSGAAVGFPITPMTLTLTVGAIAKKPALCDRAVTERDFIHLNLSYDHDVVDGAPVMRFADRLKHILRTQMIEMSAQTSPVPADAAHTKRPDR